MTENGLAALAAALEIVMRDSVARVGGPYAPLGYATITIKFDRPAFAAAILGERGVFLADGLTDDRIGLLANMNRLAEANADYGAEIDRQAADIATLRAALDDQYRETPPCPFCGHREHRDDICEQDLGEHGECQCADTRPRSDLAAVSDLLCKYIDQTAEQAATIATLRAALDGLVAAAVDFLADWDGFDDVRPSRTGDALRTALAAAREVTG